MRLNSVLHSAVAACMLAFGATAIVPSAVAGQEGTGVTFSGSGFLTAAAGKVLGGSHDSETDQGWRCPCYISDYARGGVYESGRVRIGPDSRLGLQGSASIADGHYSLTAQVVSRGTADGRPNLEWLYATALLSSKWTLQVGRKRLPLLAYSEVQDVGHAYPWINLPPQLYGWETVNYNGASLSFRDRFVGDWFGAVNVFGGTETVRDSGYWKIYNGRHSRTDVRWSGIAGAELRLSRDWFEARLVHIRADVQQRVVSAGETGFGDRYRQRIYGVSLSADWRDWVARGEALYINRTGQQDIGARDRAQLLAVGHRIGAWLPMLTYSRYREALVDPGAAEAHRTWSAVLRYDLSTTSAIKLQYTVWQDRSQPGYSSMHGNARLFAISYDLVF